MMQIHDYLLLPYFVFNYNFLIKLFSGKFFIYLRTIFLTEAFQTDTEKTELEGDHFVTPK